MPEGDVVLRTARRLTAAMGGAVIRGCDLRWPSLGGVDFTGATCLETQSYGKNLLTRFDDGRTLHTHLRMDGTWRVSASRRTGPGLPFVLPNDPDPGIRARLATDNWTCIGRHLGMMTVLRTRDESSVIGHLGPDLLAPELTEEDEAAIRAAVAVRGMRSIGAVLLDQEVAAGIGTIYMAETLFRHRISPWRTTGAITDPLPLFRTARDLMQRSADASTRPETRGSVQIVAHSRAGKPCVRCATPLSVAPVGTPPYDRPAFYCPRCQPD